MSEVITNGLVVDATTSYTSGSTSIVVSVDASSPVASISSITSPQQMHLLWDSEIVLVTATAGGTTSVTLTVTRGAEGTTAASHLTGSKLYNVATAASIAQTVQDGANTYVSGLGILAQSVIKTGDYTVVSGDSGKSVIFNSSTPQNCFLPSTIPSSIFSVTIANMGTGPVTLFTNGKNLDGSSVPVVIPTGMSLFITTDNTNYQSDRGANLSDVNYKTASYTLLPSDSNKLVSVNSGSATTMTLPYPVPCKGWTTRIQNIGSGVVTVAPNSLSNSWPPNLGGSFVNVQSCQVTSKTGLVVGSAMLPSILAYNGSFNQASAGNGWGIGAIALKTAAGTAKILQSTSTTSTGTSAVSLAFSSNLTAGSCIVVVYTANGAWNNFGTTYAASDTLSSTYTKYCAGANNPNFFVSPNTAGGACTVTVTPGGSGISGTSGQCLVIMEIAGIATSTPVDTSYSNQINGNGTISPSLTTTATSEMLLLALGTSLQANAIVTYQFLDASTSNFTINTPQGVEIVADGFNYFTFRGMSLIQKYSTSFSSATSVTVTHNLGTTNVAVSVYDSGGNAVAPETLVVTSSTVVTITFAVATTGTVVVTG